MAAGDGAQLPATVAASRSVEKALEEAAASGALNLSNRKLKEFPRTARNYDLSDITHADLSKNRLCELPEELCHFISLETLSLYHNGMRSLSSNLGNLQALTYLNLSRNLLSSLPPSVFQLSLLRVLILSNNKLTSLPSSVFSLTQLRQLDVSCNELQSLPAELCQLECLRDLNLRRNRLTTLPEEISELPLVRLDVSCNRITNVPLCYRHLRHLQVLLLDNNPLQTPPAQVCSKGKYHIFKYLNMEACKRSQSELEKHLRPTGFTSCLSDHELFTNLDSGFNSVDSGSKRWSGNESADDFSERSLRLAEVSRDQTNLEEEEEEEEDGRSLPATNRGGKLCCNGEAEQVDFIDSNVTEEEEEELQIDAPTPPLEQRGTSSSSQSQDSATTRSSLHIEVDSNASASPLPQSPSSPSLEERRGPSTLFIWQERERLQQQKQKAGLLKSSTKTGNVATPAPQTGSSSCGNSPENGGTPAGLRQRCVSAEQMSMTPPTGPPPHPSSRTDMPSSPKASSPPGQAQKPNSFLFRGASRSNVKPTQAVFTLGESGRSESRTTLRSSKEDRPDVIQLRKTLETRLKTTLPEDLGEALSNGVILCQLVNLIRPRSIAIIHVPSPAVPKLSSPKSRLNVENFIAACRKLGVPETEVCACSDVLLCKLSAVLPCVTALLTTEEDPVSRPSPPPPPLSSLLSADFFFFYCAVMTLLCAFYYCLLT
ncbi:leucine-rich repeat and calponin homology domain-containing protein 4 isoform X1 [Oryzias latipes]|uniref:leucine-rich repeat and calponin homology domain-containing protein 4 isoform X1 n=1 Tax=Oryzias latipes TaxID=8090 RepID=UPI0005CC4491|nr:leucine-rich repeat and calponin homology domain-containing protein 4 isoform X1 [Oryzias latipes]